MRSSSMGERRHRGADGGHPHCGFLWMQYSHHPMGKIRVCLSSKNRWFLWFMTATANAN